MRGGTTSTTERVFVDTNVLVHVHDLDAGRKRAIAAAVLKDLWATRRGVLSTQILQEDPGRDQGDEQRPHGSRIVVRARESDHVEAYALTVQPLDQALEPVHRAQRARA